MGGVLFICALLVVPSAEDSTVEHSSHTQHERLLPTPTSSVVTIIRPTRNDIPAATILPIRMDRRAGADGRDENLANAALNLLRMLRQERRVLRPPGIFTTVSGTFATVAGARAR